MLRMSNKLIGQSLVSILGCDGPPRKTTPFLLQILNQCRNRRLRWRIGICRRDDKVGVKRHVGNAELGPIVSTDDKIRAEELRRDFYLETFAQLSTFAR